MRKTDMVIGPIIGNGIVAKQARRGVLSVFEVLVEGHVGKRALLSAGAERSLLKVCAEMDAVDCYGAALGLLLNLLHAPQVCAPPPPIMYPHSDNDPPLEQPGQIVAISCVLLLQRYGSGKGGGGILTKIYMFS